MISFERFKKFRQQLLRQQKLRQQLKSQSLPGEKHEHKYSVTFFKNSNQNNFTKNYSKQMKTIYKFDVRKTS